MDMDLQNPYLYTELTGVGTAMYDIITCLHQTLNDASPPVMATLVDISGSAVRRRGASMMIGSDGTICGSVSGGCIESGVIQAARRVPSSGPELLRFCAVDDELFGSVAPCGGDLLLYVYPVNQGLIRSMHTLWQEGKSLVFALSTEGQGMWVGESLEGLHHYQLLSADVNAAAGNQEGQAKGQQDRQPEEQKLRKLQELAGGADLDEGVYTSGWFFIRYPATTNLAIIGGGHLSRALARIGEAVGWNCVLIEPRDLFADPRGLPQRCRVVRSWPKPALEELGLDSSWAVAALTHDSRIDDQAVGEALKRGASYVGVLGSKRTLGERKERLRQAGIEESLLEEIAGPIGLDIGAAVPEEIALAVAAQIVERKRSSR